MITQTDKQELKKWIDQIEDQAILEGLQSIRESTQQPASWDSLSPAVKKGITEGRKDIKEGRMISNRNFWKEYEHLL